MYKNATSAKSVFSKLFVLLQQELSNETSIHFPHKKIEIRTTLQKKLQIEDAGNRISIIFTETIMIYSLQK